MTRYAIRADERWRKQRSEETATQCRVQRAVGCMFVWDMVEGKGALPSNFAGVGWPVGLPDAQPHLGHDLRAVKFHTEKEPILHYQD